jgi:hypothetical protein
MVGRSATRWSYNQNVSPSPKAAPMRRLRWYLIPLRVLLVTFLLTLLSFAVSLLLGIVGVVVGAKLRGGTPNMQVAYRDVAAPTAAAVCAIVLVSSLFMEIRNYRRAKALAGIERVS